jgi:2-methylcitrate dehydratase PrpD
MLEVTRGVGQGYVAADDTWEASRAAHFAHDLRWDDVPDDVREIVLRAVLDLVGCAIGGSRAPVVATIAEYCRRQHGRGTATVIASSERTSAAGASLINAFAASALDIDDGYRPVCGHPGRRWLP